MCVAQSLWCESRIFGSRTAASVAITNCANYVHVTATPKPRQMVSAWANQVSSMLLECLDSDADATVAIVLLQMLNQLQETLENTHRSLGTRPRQDKTHCVILVLAGVGCITTWLSHHLETVTLCLQGTFVNQVLIGGFFSHFRTSVSVLRFLFQHFPLAPF